MNNQSSTETKQASNLESLNREATAYGKMRQKIDQFMRHPAVDFSVMTAILISVGLLFVELELSPDHAWFNTVIISGWILTGFFVLELSLRWIAAPSNKRFWREYWLDVVAVVPFFRPIRILRILRLLRLYRFGVIAKKFMRGTAEYNYEKELRTEIENYNGKFLRFVQMVPYLYRMFSNLLDDGRVHYEARQKISSTLAYYITPFEVMSRNIHGAEGYLDQVYISLITIQELRDELPDWLLRDAWEGEGDIIEALSEISILEQHLEPDTRDSIEEYLGLK